MVSTTGLSINTPPPREFKDRVAAAFQEHKNAMPDLHTILTRPVEQQQVATFSAQVKGQKVVIFQHDIDQHLKDGEFLNDSLIDLYLEYYVDRACDPDNKSHFHHFTTFFCDYLLRNSGVKAQEEVWATLPRWTEKKGVDIFLKDFLMIPWNHNEHWTGAILCWPGCVIPGLDNMSPAEGFSTGMGPRNPRSPCIIFMCSMHYKPPPDMASSIYAYLNFMLSRRARSEPTTFGMGHEATSQRFNALSFPLIQVDVPIQGNCYDCGCNMLRCFQKLMDCEADEVVNVINDLKQGKKKNWFSSQDANNIRDDISGYIANIKLDPQSFDVGLGNPAMVAKLPSANPAGGNVASPAVPVEPSVTLPQKLAANLPAETPSVATALSAFRIAAKAKTRQVLCDIMVLQFVNKTGFVASLAQFKDYVARHDQGRHLRDVSLDDLQAAATALEQRDQLIHVGSQSEDPWEAKIYPVGNSGSQRRLERGTVVSLKSSARGSDGSAVMAVMAVVVTQSAHDEPESYQVAIQQGLVYRHALCYWHDRSEIDGPVPDVSLDWVDEVLAKSVQKMKNLSLEKAMEVGVPLSSVMQHDKDNITSVECDDCHQWYIINKEQEAQLPAKWICGTSPLPGTKCVTAALSTDTRGAPATGEAAGEVAAPTPATGEDPTGEVDAQNPATGKAVGKADALQPCGGTELAPKYVKQECEDVNERLQWLREVESHQEENKAAAEWQGVWTPAATEPDIVDDGYGDGHNVSPSYSPSGSDNDASSSLAAAKGTLR
jgi:hypothetical protein